MLWWTLFLSTRYEVIMMDVVQRESKYKPDWTHIWCPTHWISNAEKLRNRCGFENYVSTTLKVCLVTGTSPIPVNQKIFLLMLQLSMTTTLTVQNVDFTMCIIEFSILVNLQKTFWILKMRSSKWTKAFFGVLSIFYLHLQCNYSDIFHEF